MAFPLVVIGAVAATAALSKAKGKKPVKRGLKAKGRKKAVAEKGSVRAKEK